MNTKVKLLSISSDTRQVKSKLYTDKFASIGALEDNIEALIREILVKMLERVCLNLTKRMDHLMCSHDQHLHKIILKH